MSIDASKRIDWVERFLDEAEHDICVMHLVRDPCGYVASRLRRDQQETPVYALAEWLNTNRNIAHFVIERSIAMARFS